MKKGRFWEKPNSSSRTAYGILLLPHIPKRCFLGYFYSFFKKFTHLFMKKARQGLKITFFVKNVLLVLPIQIEKKNMCFFRILRISNKNRGRLPSELPMLMIVTFIIFFYKYYNIFYFKTKVLFP